MREKLRLAILDAYGIDIDKYEFEYQTSLCAYTIRMEEYTIRVTNAADIDKELSMERLKWGRDLKQFKRTICEPVPSLKGELLVECSIGKMKLFISMFRTAKGELMTPDKIRPMFFIAAGDMLGTMHHMSMTRNNSEEKYQIPTPYVAYEKKRKKARSFMSEELNERIDKIIGKSTIKQKNLDNFGVCYGEFDLHNIIVDTNNIHLFDFDNSIYAHYMYDVASFAVSILSAGYMPGRPSKEITFEHFIPWFRIGYSINKRCDAHTFEDLGDYMELRGVWLLINLIEQYQREEIPQVKAQIEFVSHILMGEDIFDGMDRVRDLLFVKRKKLKDLKTRRA